MVHIQGLPKVKTVYEVRLEKYALTCGKETPAWKRRVRGPVYARLHRNCLLTRTFKESYILI